MTGLVSPLVSRTLRYFGVHGSASSKGASATVASAPWTVVCAVVTVTQRILVATGSISEKVDALFAGISILSLSCHFVTPCK